MRRCCFVALPLWVSADIGQGQVNIRFTPKSGHWLSAPGCPLCAKSGHHVVQQIAAYSIT
jgi:hypothetical protein